MKKFTYAFLAIGSLSLSAKEIKLENKTDSEIVVTITPGRSGKMKLGSKPFTTSVPAGLIKTVTVYSEKLGGKGDYIKDIHVTWKNSALQPGNTEVDLAYLNTFIRSDMDKGAVDPIAIQYRGRYIIEEGRWKETPEKYFVVTVPDVPSVRAIRSAEQAKTEAQVKRAGRGLENLGRMWLGLKPKR